MVIDVSYWTRVLKNTLIFIISIIIVFLSLKLITFYMPFLIAVIISLLVEPIIKKIVKKTKLTRKVSAVIVILTIFSILVGLIAWGIITLITESTDLLQKLNLYIENIYTKVNEIVSKIDNRENKIPKEFTEFLTATFNNSIEKISIYATEVLTKTLQSLTKIPVLGIYTAITILSTYFICTDKFYIVDQLEHHLPKTWVRRFTVHFKGITQTLGNYLKAESILIIITFLILIVSLYILTFLNFSITYPFLIALLTAFVDALPILGAGTVLIPWAIISASTGNINLSICLIVIYIILLVTRQIIEPKIVSNQIGIHPIFTLLSMYTGFKILGVVGLFIGPIILIVFKNIYATMIENGFVKSLLNRN